MRDYEVRIPIAGVYFTTVQAESAEEALNIAFDEAENILDEDHLEQIDLHKHLVRGNVSYAPLTHAEAFGV